MKRTQYYYDRYINACKLANEGVSKKNALKQFGLDNSLPIIKDLQDFSLTQFCYLREIKSISYSACPEVRSYAASLFSNYEKKNSDDTGIFSFSISNYPDTELVEELRNRGYDVKCTKTTIIEL